MHGLGSLSGWMAYGNANEVTLEMGERQILPIVKQVPVVCSINGTDPTIVMEVTALAHEMDFFTTAYAFTAEEARQMAEAGCDCLLAHVGLTVGGSIGAIETMSIDEAADKTREMADAARAVNPDILVLCHGGPISSPSDVEETLKRVPIDGFVGASSMERLPVEKGIREKTAEFAAIKLRP
jgi:predicted TIM-barrel enzyme